MAQARQQESEKILSFFVSFGEQQIYSLKQIVTLYRISIKSYAVSLHLSLWQEMVQKIKNIIFISTLSKKITIA